MRKFLGLVILLVVNGLLPAEVVINSTGSLASASSTGRVFQVTTLNPGGINNTAFGVMFTINSGLWRLDSLTAQMSNSISGLTWTPSSTNVRLYDVTNATGNLTLSAKSGYVDSPANYSNVTSTIAGSRTLNFSTLGNTDNSFAIGAGTYLLGLDFQGTLTGGSGSRYMQIRSQTTNDYNTNAAWSMGGSYLLNSNATWTGSTTTTSGTTSQAMVFNLNATAVPETSTLVMSFLGIASFALFSYYRKL